MTDIFDRATELEESAREAAIAAHRQRWQGAALSHCEDCGSEIPAARHAAVKNCRACIECAKAEDARRKLNRR
jgi:phage/conjugal plasmid C-4 type zinc finger TraR family protein